MVFEKKHSSPRTKDQRGRVRSLEMINKLIRKFSCAMTSRRKHAVTFLGPVISSFLIPKKADIAFVGRAKKNLLIMLATDKCVQTLSLRTQQN